MIRLIAAFLFFIPLLSFAVTDQFTVKTEIKSDTTPPSTPTLLSATATAPTQIDLAWSTSTDNTAVGGYVVQRDSFAIATTTATTYSDTGLSDNTLYTYSVYAFDTEFNNSTTSNTLSTTTLALPSTPTPTTTDSVSSDSGATKTIRLKDISVLPGTDKVDFNWETYGYSRYSLYWGETNDYSDGAISNEVYRKNHQTSIDGLEQDTLYVYRLVGYTPSGQSVTLKEGQFKTKQPQERVAPPNVRYLQTQVEGNDVRLSWQLPLVSDISVRVVRNHFGYPTDINDGLVVYEGRSENIVDKNALSFKDTQYYTVFVVNKEGDVSSGAITIAKRIDMGDRPSDTDVTQPTSSAEVIDDKKDTETKKPAFSFDPNNIRIIQSGVEKTFLTDKLMLSHEDTFTISIPYEALPEHLKSIVVTITDPTNHKRSYSFLLRLNSTKTNYEAVIAPLNVVGESLFKVEVFDFESQTIGTYTKSVEFVESTTGYGGEREVVFPDMIFALAKKIIPSILFLIFLALILWWFYKKRRSEDNL